MPWALHQVSIKFSIDDIIKERLLPEENHGSLELKNGRWKEMSHICLHELSIPNCHKEKWLERINLKVRNWPTERKIYCHRTHIERPGGNARRAEDLKWTNILDNWNFSCEQDWKSELIPSCCQLDRHLEFSSNVQFTWTFVTAI